MSGDCRRALDICRRATEIAGDSSSKSKEKQMVNFGHVSQALSEMFASPKIRAIKSCTKYEKLFLQAVGAEITRTGIEEVDFYGVFMQIATLGQILGVQHSITEGLFYFSIISENVAFNLIDSPMISFFLFSFSYRSCNENMLDIARQQTLDCRGQRIRIISKNHPQRISR